MLLKLKNIGCTLQKNKIGIVLKVSSLLILAVIIYGGYRLAILLLEAFSKINPTVGAGMLAATATILVSVISVLVAKRLEFRAVLLKELRERKTPVYEEMVKLIFHFTFAEKIGLPPFSDQEVIKKMAWLTENIVIWGSDDLLLSWNRFRTFAVRNLENPSHQLLFEVENLLLAIRKDLGHANTGVTRGKILELFINDLHTIQ